jgi:glycosyltransferase involved in cell wall biosynthesis
MNIVLLLDPRGALSNLDKQTIERQTKYIECLNDLTSDKISLVILTGSNLITTKVREDYLQIEKLCQKTWNPIKFAFLAKKYLLGNGFNPKLILAGDPWISFHSAYVLTKMLNRDIPIQVQLHADISDQRWTKINLKNRIKAKLVGFSLSNSSSIRVVTPEIASRLSPKFKNIENKIVISPMPLNISDVKNPKVLPNALGFIGRMEKDRGIDLLPMFASISYLFDEQTSLILIGSGSSLSKTLKNIKNRVPNMSVTSYGYLTGSDFENKMSEIGILLSLAPSESYGRTVRECLIQGIPVLALNSKSMNCLEMQYPNSGLKTFELEELHNGKIEIKITELRSSGVKENLKRHILSINEETSNILAQSWKDLIDEDESSQKR